MLSYLVHMYFQILYSRDELAQFWIGPIFVSCDNFCHKNCESRNKCFSGTLLLFRWSSRCWKLISGSSAFPKSSLNIWKFTVHLLLKPGLENFEHYFTSVWDECNCVVVWAFFGIAFLWDWNEDWPFPVPWPLLSFPNLLACWVQHFHSIIF